jgi:hypothetical protein
MDKFWELLERSVIIQSVITLGLLATVCYMYIAGRRVPNELWMITELAVGFWMGSKVQSEANRRTRPLEK